MSDQAPKVRPLSAAAHAQRWAVELLQDTAQRLESLPRKQRADAFHFILPALKELERVQRKGWCPRNAEEDERRETAQAA